jgi:TonB family protein
MRTYPGFSLLLFLLYLGIPASSIVAKQPSPPQGSAAVDAKGVRHTWGVEWGEHPPWRADVTKVVPPAYPYEARRARQEGLGVFRLQLDLATGRVTKATVLKSTGIVMLDNSALWALRRWQVKPGRWREIEFPISFSLSAPQPLPPPKAR